MIVDLHSHYPMHLVAGEPGTLEVVPNAHAPSLSESIRALALRTANHLANYQGRGGGPAVTLANLSASNVRVALSVLYAPFDEMDLGLPYGAPPRGGYFQDLLRQIALVEGSVAGHDDVTVAHDPASLDAALSANRVALVHAVEGGFHLGDTVEAVIANVATLAQQGVAYITLAHLFWRQVATNAPALPFLPDGSYATLFPQPASGLSALGRAAVTAMVARGILVDVTHMSAASFSDTVALLDELDPPRSVPVIASHGACSFGGLKYNLTDDQVRAIAARGGVVGLIACTHYMADGQPQPHGFSDSVDIVCKHIERLETITGSHDFTAIGSDQDGFIKPTLPGLETPPNVGGLEAEIARRFGDDVARRISFSNARRVLSAWGRPGPASVVADVTTGGPA